MKRMLTMLRLKLATTARDSFSNGNFEFISIFICLDKRSLKLKIS